MFQAEAGTAGTTREAAGRTRATAIGVKAGGAAKCSSANWSPDWNSAQCTGFSLSVSAHGTSMAISILVAGASCGQTYAAIAIPEARTLMTRKHATKR